jgi:hypothetical protein
MAGPALSGGSGAGPRAGRGDQVARAQRRPPEIAAPRSRRPAEPAAARAQRAASFVQTFQRESRRPDARCGSWRVATLELTVEKGVGAAATVVAAANACRSWGVSAACGVPCSGPQRGPRFSTRASARWGGWGLASRLEDGAVGRGSIVWVFATGIVQHAE